jgi:hypothetical protein
MRYGPWLDVCVYRHTILSPAKIVAPPCGKKKSLQNIDPKKGRVHFRVYFRGRQMGGGGCPCRARVVAAAAGPVVAFFFSTVPVWSVVQLHRPSIQSTPTIISHSRFHCDPILRGI